MTSSIRNRRLKPMSASGAWQLAIPLAYFTGDFLFHPFRSEFAMDLDEGLNLVKAMLVARGESLYTQIWSDQPPLLTYLLATEFQALGSKILLARLSILALACVLLWATIQFLYRTAGSLPALLAAGLLFLLPEFIRLSVSVMIGLPSITFAMLSLLFLALWHQRRRYPWLILSSLALGLSVMTKLMTGFLTPIFLMGLLVEQLPFARRKEFRLTRFVPIAAWGVVFSAMVGLLVLWVGPGNLGQLFENHLAVSALEVFRTDPTLWLNWHLQESIPILAIALLSLFFIVRAKNWILLYPLAWAVFAYLMLFRRIPAWSHHQLLVTVPAAILAAYALGEGIGNWIQAWRKGSRPVLSTSLITLANLALLLIFLIPRVPQTLAQFNPYPSLKSPPMRQTSAEVRFLNLIRKYAPGTRWFVTDQPMYAFRAELPIPPNLAVFTATRVYTGQLTEAEVLETIQQYQPEEILLGFFEFPSINAYLQGRYELVHSSGTSRLYIRQDIYE